MPKQDIMVIGASAAGVEALQLLAAQLPAGLPVVIHVAPRVRSVLASILSRCGALPAQQAEDGIPIKWAHICGGARLLPGSGAWHIHASLGPKEQHRLPSINVTFRSAALAYGERVAGIVLTGEME
jgi:two-component system, chemotaxis family, protein-glutamate methylesterase/glutaminase